jgi:hypothetical protein
MVSKYKLHIHHYAYIKRIKCQITFMGFLVRIITLTNHKVKT